jgi:hypothetical protein
VYTFRVYFVYNSSNNLRGIGMEEEDVRKGLRRKIISAGLLFATLATVAIQLFLLKKTDKAQTTKTTEAIMVDPNN